MPEAGRDGLGPWASAGSGHHPEFMGRSWGLLHPFRPAGGPRRANFVLLQKPHFLHTQKIWSQLRSKGLGNRDPPTYKKKKKVFSQCGSLFCVGSENVYSTLRVFRCKFRGERLDVWFSQNEILGVTSPQCFQSNRRFVEEFVVSVAPRQPSFTGKHLDTQDHGAATMCHAMWHELPMWFFGCVCVQCSLEEGEMDESSRKTFTILPLHSGTKDIRWANASLFITEHVPLLLANVFSADSIICQVSAPYQQLYHGHFCWGW